MSDSLSAEDIDVLVSQAQAGEKEAFGRLYEVYLGPIYRYLCIHIGDTFEAEDMTAQVFLKALEALSSYRRRQVPFSAWLFRVAHNMAIDHFRRQKRRQTVPVDDNLSSQDLGPLALTELILTMEELQRQVSQLTPLQQQVIALRFGGGLSLAEAANVLGRSPGAIKALQHAALTQLRQHFAP